MDGRFWWSLPALALLLTGGLWLTRAAYGDEPAAPAPPARATAQAINDFGFRLLQALRADATGNVVVSPLSLSQALAMTCNGAAGATQQAMLGTLGARGMTLEALNDGQRALQELTQASDPRVTTTLANALWVGCPLREEFLARNRDFYRAQVTQTDITSDAGVQAINAWVKDATRGKISDLMKPGDLDPLCRLVLTNAILFKGAWTTEFDRAQTRDGAFTLADGTTKTVPLMTVKSQFGYLRADGMQAVRLPYGKGRLAMYLLLPDADLATLAPRLTAQQWAAWMPRFTETECRVVLPRFTARYDEKLNGALAALGMGIAFSGKADFSGMNGRQDLFIKMVRHQAVLEVNEEGTEAAAASAVVIKARSIPRELVVAFTRPFLCAIRDDETGVLLFLGEIRNPA